MQVFLALNGWDFAPDPAQAVQMILGLACGDIEESELVNWIEESCHKA